MKIEGFVVSVTLGITAIVAGCSSGATNEEPASTASHLETYCPAEKLAECKDDGFNDCQWNGTRGDPSGHWACVNTEAEAPSPPQ